jgi:TatA/E family protein of Tat protein translocase
LGVLTTDYCFLYEPSCLRGKNKKEGILFGTIGWSEIIIILIIALLLFGAKRLPEVGKSLGKAIREFKRAFSGLSEDLEEEEPPSNKPKKKE